MNIFYSKNIFYEHSKNEKLNYLQTVKIDSSTHRELQSVALVPVVHRELQNVVYMKKNRSLYR
jgi:hypothetical protein